MLVSAIYQHESAIGIHMSPPFYTSLPILPLSVDSEPLFEFPELTADSHWLSILLEKEMATHSSSLAWRIPWMEEPGRLQSMGSQRVGHD